MWWTSSTLHLDVDVATVIDVTHLPHLRCVPYWPAAIYTETPRYASHLHETKSHSFFLHKNLSNLILKISLYQSFHTLIPHLLQSRFSTTNTCWRISASKTISLYHRTALVNVTHSNKILLATWLLLTLTLWKTFLYEMCLPKGQSSVSQNP